MDFTFDVFRAIRKGMENVTIDGAKPTVGPHPYGKVCYIWPNGTEVEVNVAFKNIPPVEVFVKCYFCETKRCCEVPLKEGRYEYKCRRCGEIILVFVDSNGVVSA